MWQSERAKYSCLMNDDELRKMAKRRLKDRANFKNFLWIWFGVSALLVIIWAITSVASGQSIFFWPAWPIAGMGIAAFFMGLAAYGPQSSFITESAIDAEVERIKGKSRPV
jgi:2TM domain